MKYADENKPELAEETCRKALQLDPSRAETWYNLGLLYKYQNRWQESFQANLEAYSLNPQDQATCWNLGIAATALHDWENARMAWLACGIEIDDSFPAGMNMGTVPIRLDTEVVWCDRIDPARGIIRSIPFPGSERHYGDIILHDGAVNGYRIVNGHEIPVFDMLDLWQSSNYSTFRIEAVFAQEADYTALEKLISEYPDTAIEDWTASRVTLCKECSEGTIHTHHDIPQIWQTKRELGIATKTPGLIDEIIALSKAVEVIYCERII